MTESELYPSAMLLLLSVRWGGRWWLVLLLPGLVGFPPSSGRKLSLRRLCNCFCIRSRDVFFLCMLIVVVGNSGGADVVYRFAARHVRTSRWL